MLHVNIKKRAKLTKETDRKKSPENCWWNDPVLLYESAVRADPPSIAIVCELCSGLWYIVNYSYSQLLTVIYNHTPHYNSVLIPRCSLPPLAHPWSGVSDQKSKECHKNTALECDSQEAMTQWPKRSMSQLKLNCCQRSIRCMLRDTINKNLMTAFKNL